MQEKRILFCDFCRCCLLSRCSLSSLSSLSFSLSFFPLFSPIWERIFFSNFAQKNPKRFDHRKTPPRNRKRSGERDLTKTFDLSLSLLKRTDALFYFALWWRVYSLVVLSLHFLSHSFSDFCSSLVERTNEWMISKRLSDLRLLWSDVCSSKTPLSFLT